MNLHYDLKLFSDTMRAASEHLDIKLEFIEKDYWITLVLSRLANSKYVSEAVFKGGTSLSKGYHLIDRFSEDVDIAIVTDKNKTGNEVKTIIRTIEKEITPDLTELQLDGVTSKGSRFRKSIFEYESTFENNRNNKLIVEINSFANPFPFQKREIKSFVNDFENTWQQLKVKYQTELSALAYRPIPDDEMEAKQFKNLIKRIQ